MYLVYRRYRQCPERSKLNEVRTEPASIVAVVGSGGHTREMLRLMSALSGNYSPRHYVVAYTDSISENKVHSLEDNLRKKKNLKNEYLIHKIPRCREVNQSWFTSFVCTVYSVLYCIPLMFICRPEIVLCNGPGTCIPVCLIGWLLKFIGFVKTRIIYVESICRVERLSMTGKLLYNFADNIIVQWPELQVKYPKCEYYGRLV
ncbi:hypothetical protein LOTGIDRAFT_165683 [Lottia gigantea]|uniref:UDP-N-acetylglucosamine transferase subunit ALG14 n=1 Tax=Lottia gigantea TaxID=225164 RepID=V3ZZZ8_LOTGI|nr:hypothetical protein LOTGIDRAFT_165683 [Lottia gigantea]ESO88250.1 hypothetical protein LOTGIDRAFT_165683 [Lottia gigantea]